MALTFEGHPSAGEVERDMAAPAEEIAVVMVSDGDLIRIENRSDSNEDIYCGNCTTQSLVLNWSISKVTVRNPSTL
jgi:hypothetical protein